MTETIPCPACGAQRPADSPDGLCPLCLLRLGLDGAPAAAGGDARPPNPRGPRAPQSLRAHETIIGPWPDPDAEFDEAEPLVTDGRLVLLREIARGGVGVVFLGRDMTLGRDVAVKVLQARHRDRPEMIRRFVEEARIAGQLQHTGIVPIHELGQLGDRRPYFSMKLVKGQTLAEILAERADPIGDRPHLLAIFLQVAQTIAYAHDHGVIHLDLKPANIMVGKYGEVRVMDWGLARVLTREGEGGPVGPSTGPASRRGGPSGEAMPGGRLMGTPDYMAPEQFDGEPGRVDERTDVYALGLILREILTGRPTARGGGPSPASESLARCGADPELVLLARACLAADPSDRPRHAGEVAGRLSAHLEGIQERLRRADLERAEAQAREAEANKRRRLTALLAVLIVALVALASVSYAGLLQQRQVREAAADHVLRELDRLRYEALSDPMSREAPWRSARDAAGRARLLLADAPPEARRRLSALDAEIEAGSHRAEVDRRLLEQIEFAYAQADEGNFREADERLAAAFRDGGLGRDLDDPAELGRRISSAPAGVAQALAVALDCWAIIRREREGNLREPDVGPWRAPLAAARAADPDPWRERLREALERRDHEGLARLAEADDLERRPAASLWLLGRLLVWDHQTERAQRMLARAWRAHPDDYWINLDLSLFLSFPPMKPDLALIYNTSTLAIRPDSAAAHLRRGELIADRDFREAEAEIRQALRIWPGYDYAHSTLADLLARRGRWREAADEYRAAIRLSPRRHEANRLRLAEALAHLGEPREGAPEPPGRPERFEHWYGLGVIRLRRGDDAGAIAALGRAASLADPGTPTAEDASAARDQAEARARLRDVLRGRARARDNAERIALIRRCDVYGWAAGAARLYAEALRIEPDMAPIRGGSPAWHAARYAARAGTGPTGDDPPPDDDDRAGLRKQALAWMRAELDAWTARIAPDRPETCARAAEYFRRYQTDPAMAGVRDPKALEALPADERAAWKAFWDDLAARQAAIPTGTTAAKRP